MQIQRGDHLEYEIDNAATSFDAMDWARSMSSRFGMPVDEALPWCASMLMRGYDEHASRARAEHAVTVAAEGCDELQDDL